MTVLTICQDALKEIGGFEVPDTFIGNNNETAVSALAVFIREGKRLTAKYDWQELIVEKTETTVANDNSYDRPDDFKKMVNETQWDRTNNLEMNGPVNPAMWQFFKSSVTGESGTINRWFRMRGNQLLIHPTPTVTGDTLVYEYYSKNWITKQADSTTVATPAADNDTPRLDEDLLTLGTKWRFLKSKGISWEAEYREYEDLLHSLRAQNGGNARLRLDTEPQSVLQTNVPDQGYGL